MRQKIYEFVQSRISGQRALLKGWYKNFTGCFNWKFWSVAGGYFLLQMIYFHLMLPSPRSIWQDIAVSHLLLVLFAFVLPFFVFTAPLRKFLFYYLLQILILAAEIVNFKLTSQFEVERSLRYGMTVTLCAFLMDFAQTAFFSSFKLKKCAALISLVLQILFSAVFVGVLVRNIIDGKVLEVESVTAVYQTDLSETLSFIWLNKGILTGVILLALSALLLGWYYISLPPVAIPRSYGWVVLVAVLSLPVFYMGYSGARRYFVKGKVRIFSLLVNGNAFRTALAKFNSEAAQWRAVPLTEAEAEKVLKKGNDGRFILIIGESNSREYMGCFGYKENTTPFLSRMKQDKRFTFFPEVYSNHVHTTNSIQQMLTEENQYGNKNSLTVSVFDVLRHCGYHTAFISNQYLYDNLRSPVSAISQSADEICYINSEMDFVMRKNRLDMDAVEHFSQHRGKPRELTVIHLMSCHAPYQVRYPAGFRSDLKSDYERAVAYCDHVLENLFQKVLSDPSVKGVVFIPDHGEDVVLGDHDSAGFTTAMIKIPMICYLSDDYIAANPELFQRVKKAQNRCFTNDLLFDMLLDLMGIETAFNPPGLHLFNDNYALDYAKGRTLHGKSTLDGRFLTGEKPRRNQ